MVEKNYEISKLKITDLNKVVYGSFSDYNEKHSISFRDTLDYNNIVLEKSENYPNIVWSILNWQIAEDIISHINKYSFIRYSEISLYLGNKKNAYENYYKFKKKFPNDFEYMAESYLMPSDKNIVEQKFANYTFKKDDLWLCKQSNGSLGEGIYFIKDYQGFLNCNELISRYIHNPHLYQKYKYHIRMYNFISNFLPLRIYIYKEGQIMKASHEYNYDLSKIEDKQTFLTNAHINFGKEGYKADVSLHELKNQIIKEGGNWTYIWEQMKDISIKIILTVYDKEYIDIKKYNKTYDNRFIYFGLDVMIDENYKVWFLEINDAAHMEEYDEVNEKNKVGIATDIFNILGLIPFDHSNDIPVENKKCYFKDKDEEMINEAFCEFSRPQGNLELVFPVKETLSYYKQFIKDYDENLKLWNLI